MPYTMPDNLYSPSPSINEKNTKWGQCLSDDNVRVYHPHGVDWKGDCTKLCHAFQDAPRRSTTVIFATLKAIGKCNSPEKFNYFPDDFYPVVNADLNGSFHSKYTIDEEDKISSHISWSCFKIKKITPDEETLEITYGWLQVAVLVHFHAETGRQTVFFIDLPSDHEDVVINKSLSGSSRSDNPFIWHTILSRQAKSLYDATVWSIRDLVRPVEKERNQPKPPAPNFPNLHDIARHVSHTNEILQVAEHTLDRLIQAQVSWKTEYCDNSATGSVRRNRMVCVQNKQDLIFLAKEIHSLKTRSASLSERLQNEINLAFNIVSQNLGKSAQGDNAMMKTIAIVCLLYVPGSFVSSLFGMNFFDMDQSKNLPFRIGSGFTGPLQFP